VPDDLDDDTLDALFAEALAATEQRQQESRAPANAARSAPSQRPSPAPDPEDEADRSMHFVIDTGFHQSVDDSLADEVPSLRSLEDDPHDGHDVDDLQRELHAALSDDEKADPDDLEAEMEKLLRGSLADEGRASDENPALAFPKIEDEDGDEEILAAGAEGIEVISKAADAELERLRAQVAELSLALSTRDLELRTAEERTETLEAQVVQGARQLANVGRDFESFRRRAERDKEENQKFAAEKVLKDFLPVLDNLERALSHSGTERNSPLGQGVEMTQSQFGSVLRRAGVERVETAPGTPFDPSHHEAVGQEHDGAVEAGRVCRVMQAGFTIHGRLLRAAMVTISLGPKKAAAQAVPPPLAADETLAVPSLPAESADGGAESSQELHSQETETGSHTAVDADGRPLRRKKTGKSKKGRKGPDETSNG
jgi:molecular chaperone GrpE